MCFEKKLQVFYRRSWFLDSDTKKDLPSSIVAQIEERGKGKVNCSSLSPKVDTLDHLPFDSRPLGDVGFPSVCCEYH